MDLRSRFERDGFLVLEGFVGPADCDALIARAADLVAGFRADTISVFTTREQERTSDAYFLGSGDRIRYFFEEEAFGPDGALVVPVSRAINKIGHALHDLDPVFARFSRDPRLASLAAAIGMVEPLLLQSRRGGQSSVAARLLQRLPRALGSTLTTFSGSGRPGWRRRPRPSPRTTSPT